MKKMIIILASLLLISSNIAAFATGVFDKNFTGTQKEYYADGTQKYEVNVIKGKKQGLEIFWYPNGKKTFKPIMSMTKKTVCGTSGMKMVS